LAADERHVGGDGVDRRVAGDREARALADDAGGGGEAVDGDRGGAGRGRTVDGQRAGHVPLVEGRGVLVHVEVDAVAPRQERLAQRARAVLPVVRVDELVEL